MHICSVTPTLATNRICGLVSVVQFLFIWPLIIASYRLSGPRFARIYSPWDSLEFSDRAGLDPFAGKQQKSTSHALPPELGAIGRLAVHNTERVSQAISYTPQRLHNHYRSAAPSGWASIGRTAQHAQRGSPSHAPPPEPGAIDSLVF